MGRPERALYAKTLSASGEIPPPVARFALLGTDKPGHSYGANRNSILLQTLGTLILSADDDTTGTPGIAPGTSSGLRLNAAAETAQLWFFRDRKSALAFPAPANLDIAAEHERLLGARLASAIGDFGPGEAFAALLNDADPHMWLSVCTGKGRILVSANGMAGDSGMAKTDQAIRMVGDQSSRQRLAAPDAWHAALGSREMVRQAPLATLTHAGPLISTCVGLDNRALLPSFCPVYRNEDGIFGQVLSQCFPHAYTAHLPFVLRHVPEARTSRAMSNPTAAGELRFSDVVLACLASWSGAPPALPEAARMRSLGRHLIEWSSLPVDDFFEALQMPLCNRAATMVRACESLLTTYSPQPDDPWGADLKETIRQLRQSMLNPARPLPTDLFEDYPPESVANATCDLLRQYGEVLYWWPAIVEKTRILAAKGCNLARPVISKK